MSLLKELDLTASADTVSYNTGSLFDLPTGRYEQGVDGKWYLNGGLTTHVNAIVGPNGSFKSTVACSTIMRSAAIYKNSDVIILDTENSLDKDKDRAHRMVGELDDNNIEDRTAWLSGIDYTLGRSRASGTEDIYEVIKSICKKKEEHRKDYMRVSPFMDTKTKQPLKLWVPTYIFIDSLTELTTAVEDDALTNGTNFSETNTVAMADGNKKTLFTHAIRKMCQKYGLVFVATGHYDKVVQMDMYNPTPKETSFAMRDYKTKGCGAKFKFLSSLYARTNSSVLLDSSKKLPLYGDASGGPAKDVVEIALTLERCKTANAGEATPFVATQSNGILNAVTYYHYLRLHEYYGMNGNQMKQQMALLPDLTISRNTIRSLTESTPQLRRALELTAQYCFIKNNWNLSAYPLDFSKSPKELFDILNSDKNKNLISDILNSRGYWTFDKECDTPYMSLLDVLALLPK